MLYFLRNSKCFSSYLFYWSLQYLSEEGYNKGYVTLISSKGLVWVEPVFVCFVFTGH